ncbi:hypothetical protein C8R43DRAFT_1122462 [Mycena crocata]|nr:hypothetical protein C8R43DRAFT_1122462 [Mycena crocata]
MAARSSRSRNPRQQRKFSSAHARQLRRWAPLGITLADLHDDAQVWADLTPGPSAPLSSGGWADWDSTTGAWGPWMTYEEHRAIADEAQNGPGWGGGGWGGGGWSDDVNDVGAIENPAADNSTEPAK